jgi:hypothetical protein
MNDAELLLRIAEMLKQEIAPSIDTEYPKTQAFMAAVVLQKLGRQVALAQTHARAAVAELDALIIDLTVSAADAPSAIRDAVAQLSQSRDAAALCGLVESIYASRDVLGDRRFEGLLARVRCTLRADVDRRLEYAE